MFGLKRFTSRESLSLARSLMSLELALERCDEIAVAAQVGPPVHPLVTLQAPHGGCLEVAPIQSFIRVLSIFLIIPLVTTVDSLFVGIFYGIDARKELVIF